MWKFPSLSRLPVWIVAKLEYIGPVDKSTFTISQAKLYSFTLIINWESKKNKLV